MPDVKKIIAVAGPGVPVRGDDVDTDQVIPARFMKEVTFDNMGEYAFYDVRRNDDGSFNDHPFNRFEGARILVVNKNFGCGSSREHAPQALMRWGVHGIVGESFAEIFAGNCQALGIPTVTANGETVRALQDRIERQPDEELVIDVENEVIRVGGDIIDVDITASQRQALLSGQWDTTVVMREHLDDVRRTYDMLPYTQGFSAVP